MLSSKEFKILYNELLTPKLAGYQKIRKDQAKSIHAGYKVKTLLDQVVPLPNCDLE